MDVIDAFMSKMQLDKMKLSRDKATLQVRFLQRNQPLFKNIHDLPSVQEENKSPARQTEVATPQFQQMPFNNSHVAPQLPLVPQSQTQ